MGGMGGRRENEKEARPLEEPIYFKGWENHSNQKLYGKHASVSDVFISYALFYGKKVRKIAKRLFVGGGVTWRGKFIWLNGKWCVGIRRMGGWELGSLSL